MRDGNMRFLGDGDESDIIENQKKLSNMINVRDVARVRTIYEKRKNFTKYIEISKGNLPKYSIDNPEKDIPVSDGLITREEGIGLLLPLADCLGVVVFDEKQKIIGLLHAGRHNVEQNGPKKFIEYFINNFGSNPKDIKLLFSPYAINYNISKLNKNLGEAAREQFFDIGIMSEKIMDPKIDTASNENFPSYSSGDTERRFAIVAKLVRR